MNVSFETRKWMCNVAFDMYHSQNNLIVHLKIKTVGESNYQKVTKLIVDRRVVKIAKL